MTKEQFIKHMGIIHKRYVNSDITKLLKVKERILNG